MQFGETIVVEIVAGVIAHAVIEGIKHFQLLRKVPIRLALGGEPIVVDQVSPELEATITKNLLPTSEPS
jgi:hypothetical protein